MKRFAAFLVFTLMIACEPSQVNSPDEPQGITPITLVIHGGAGTLRKENMSDQQQKAYHAALGQALDAGYAVLASGGRSLDAVITAISLLQDSPLFNAGKGAVV